MSIYVGGPKTDYSAMQGPCPEGFHVPTKDEWVTLCGILTSTFGMSGSATTMGTYLKMPRVGYRNYSDASVSNEGTNGEYWSSTAYPNSTEHAYILFFNSSNLSPQGSVTRATGVNVRCFKDTPVTPDSSWTTLYQGTGSAGVFWNSSLGLISVSGDGTTWYTIQDKNLGATTVYNEGDTLTDNNCGKFYQWGNNYGFPHSGTVTMSYARVDASSYGPGNYYSSSTFIIGNYDWSSVHNNNLWGGVTGVVQSTGEIKNIYVGTTPVKEVFVGTTKVRPTSRLPAAYQEVEYIASSGSQRIDTGVCPNNANYGFETKIYPTTASGDRAVMDIASVNIDRYRYGLAAYGTSDWQVSSPYEYSTRTTVSSPRPATNTIFTLTYNYNGNLKFVGNGVTTTLHSAGSAYSYSTNRNIFCFAYGSNSYARFGIFRLYYMKIWNGTTLLRDFVPCYRKSDNLIGVYDLVNNQFYTNSGSGSFTKGPNVNV